MHPYCAGGQLCRADVVLGPVVQGSNLLLIFIYPSRLITGVPLKGVLGMLETRPTSGRVGKLTTTSVLNLPLVFFPEHLCLATLTPLFGALRCHIGICRFLWMEGQVLTNAIWAWCGCALFFMNFSHQICLPRLLFCQGSCCMSPYGRHVGAPLSFGPKLNASRFHFSGRVSSWDPRSFVSLAGVGRSVRR